MLKLQSILAAGVVAGCLGIAWVTVKVVHAEDPKPPAKPTTTPTTQPDVDKTPVNKMCAVETDQPIDPSVTVVYNGKTYAFCCKDCVAKFNNDPEKYIANAK